MVNWNKDVVDVRVVYSSAHAIYCKIILLNGGYSWFHSFVYGYNNGVKRRILWTGKSWGIFTHSWGKFLGCYLLISTQLRVWQIKGWSSFKFL